MTTLTKRREARELAFAIIFEKSFSSDSVDDIIKTAELARDIMPDEFTIELANGVFDHLELIDSAVEKHCVSRSLARLSRVVLAVLRLAVYEIVYLDDIDISISINEAVELAKKYAGDDEAGFVNGVLGGFVRSDDLAAVKADRDSAAQSADALQDSDSDEAVCAQE